MHKLNSTSLDHQFRSRWCLRALKCLYMRSTPSLRSFSNAVFETVPVSMGDDGPHLSFQGRSSSTSSFHASLLQATDGVMPLALCPQVLSTATCDGCFTRLSTCCHFPSQRHVQGSTPASLPAQSFPFTAACPAQHTRRSFQRGMLTTDTFQPGLPVPLFITSSLNL